MTLMGSLRWAAWCGKSQILGAHPAKKTLWGMRRALSKAGTPEGRAEGLGKPSRLRNGVRAAVGCLKPEKSQ